MTMKQENNTGGKGTGRGEEGEQELHFQSGSLHCQGGEDTGEFAAFAEAFQAGVFMSYGCVVRVWVPPLLTPSPQRSHFGTRGPK